jgi:hypothetical protein
MPITLEQAKQLTYGDIIYSNRFLNASKEHPIRWRVNGQVKTWKRDPDRIQIPVKHGLYDHAYLCHGDIADSIYSKIILDLEDFELDEDIAKEKCLL